MSLHYSHVGSSDTHIHTHTQRKNNISWFRCVTEPWFYKYEWGNSLSACLALKLKTLHYSTTVNREQLKRWAALNRSRSQSTLLLRLGRSADEVLMCVQAPHSDQGYVCTYACRSTYVGLSGIKSQACMLAGFLWPVEALFSLIFILD